MSTSNGQRKNKLNQVLVNWRDGEVHTLPWFAQFGLNRRNVSQYQKSGLLKALGGGAYLRSGDQMDWMAALSAAQFEQDFPAHVAGASALHLQGTRSNLPLGRHPTVSLMCQKMLNLPSWIRGNDWGAKFNLRQANLFDSEEGVFAYKEAKYPLMISCRERAVLELVNQLDLQESFETLENYMEGMKTLRSRLVQNLLETCRSIKVKRVFLYVAESLNLPWTTRLNTEKIDLGTGKRVVVKGGRLDKKYIITVPNVGQENPF